MLLHLKIPLNSFFLLLVFDSMPPFNYKNSYRLLQRPSKSGIFVLSKFMRFFLTSGIGWLIDLAIFTTLVKLGYPVMLSALIGSSLAVLFVYSASVRFTFLSSEKASHRHKVFILFIFQSVNILFYSYLISLVQKTISSHYEPEAHTVISLVAKILVTPFSLITNYIFLQQLIERFSFKKKETT